MSDDTILVLSGVGITPYSARGLSQTLEPIDTAANMRRTINGNLRDLSATQFRKYKSTITAKDQSPPALAGAWPGKVVTVDCVVELAVAAGTALDRTAVPGSTRTEGGFTYYRPRLIMRVRNYTNALEEWRADYAWSLQLEEV